MDEEGTTTPRQPGEIAGQGPSPVDKVQADYFSFDKTETVLLPDGVSYVEIKKLTEGDRRSYLNATNRDVKIERRTGDAAIRTAPGTEREILLEAAIVGWNLTREGKPVPFSKGSKGSTLSQFLLNADPVVVDVIEKAVRMANPWLLSDMTVEEIDKEIENLQDMRAKLIEQEEGNDSSSNK